MVGGTAGGPCYRKAGDSTSETELCSEAGEAEKAGGSREAGATGRMTPGRGLRYSGTLLGGLLWAHVHRKRGQGLPGSQEPRGGRRSKQGWIEDVFFSSAS